MGKNLEIVGKNVDLKLLSDKIQRFLKDSNKSAFDYSTFKVESLPDSNGFCILIEYGMKNPTTNFAVVVEGEPNNFKIHEDIDKVEVAAVAALNFFRPFGIADIGNASFFYQKFWKFVETTVPLLENSNKS